LAFSLCLLLYHTSGETLPPHLKLPEKAIAYRLTIEELKVHYNWTEEDEESLRKVSWIGEKYKEESVKEFYRYLENFPDTGKYLSSEEVKERHKEKINL
jgi:hypothetical protein